MEWLKGMLVYVLVGIVTGVASLDVYLDTEKRIQVPANIDINCSLPNVPNNSMALSPLHIETPVETEDRVWIGWQRNFTKWIDFRGCIKKTFSSKINNKSIDISDPFLDCYKFCDSFSFMLSSLKCFCPNTSQDPDQSGLLIVNSSFVGNTNNVMCMYQPLTNYMHELDEQRDGDCLFAFKANNTFNFSNDLCFENKTSLCIARKSKTLYDNKYSTWLNITDVCKHKGTFFPSYSIIKENREIATKHFKDAQHYWIAAFRRPLNTCLAAVLYTNGTLGESKPTSCNTPLRSLCIRNVESEESTGNVDPVGSTGNVEPGGSPGNVDPGGSTGNVEPGGSTGNVDPGGSTGKFDPGESMGKSDQTPGYVWGILASICVLCTLVAILLYLYIRKVQESKNKTKKRSSPVDKAVSSTQTRAGVQPQRQDKSATIEEIQEYEYHTIGASCPLSGSDEAIYHELHEKPRSQETHDCSNYDHVTHAMIADNTHYDVFVKKGKSSSSDNVISDYDTTFSIKQKLEGDYDTAGGEEIDRDLSEYDSIAGPSRANEDNSI
ncbi:hypothetical protein KP79_PYT03284 [Mizuhopecten yessoensis]|uniref:Uncharacterized protein n=1 Tax=Mizuhopecten yessoensis TaxID=6573 RepID=A0A210PHH2_MIZYE|nr:hypothetical protein KP79_PYT03284 [Mizuhopecten yessoensis]